MNARLRKNSDLYYSPNIFMVIKSKGKGLMGHIVGMAEKKCSGPKIRRKLRGGTVGEGHLSSCSFAGCSPKFPHRITLTRLQTR
jgi:hypothetical protein